MLDDILITILMCLLLAVAAHFIIPSYKHKKIYIILSLIGVILRAASVMYLYSKGVDTFGTDGLVYHKAGLWISKQLEEGTPLYAVKYVYTLYTVLVGLIYHMLGINRYIVSYINIVFAYFSAVLLLKTALNLRYKFSNASFISLVFLYFPNLILWTSDSRKEALTIFICTLSCYCLQRLSKNSEASGKNVADAVSDSEVFAHDSVITAAYKAHIKDKTHEKTEVFTAANPTKINQYEKQIQNACLILIMCILMWLCTLIRIYMFVPMSIGILASLFILYLKSRKQIYILFGLAVIISSVLIFFFTVCPLLENYHAISFPDEMGDLGTDLANKAKTIRLLASNRNILLAAVNYFLVPYPGNTGISEINGSVALNMAVSIDMIFWYICMLLMVPGILSAARKKESFLLGLTAFLASYIIINILVVENVSDTIYRYRSVITGLSLLLIDHSAVERAGSFICNALRLHSKSKLSPNSNIKNDT